MVISPNSRALSQISFTGKIKAVQLEIWFKKIILVLEVTPLQNSFKICSLETTGSEMFCRMYRSSRDCPFHCDDPPESEKPGSDDIRIDWNGNVGRRTTDSGCNRHCHSPAERDGIPCNCDISGSVQPSQPSCRRTLQNPGDGDRIRTEVRRRCHARPGAELPHRLSTEQICSHSSGSYSHG